MSIDITPDKGWIRDDMFVPAGFHMEAEFTGTASSPPEGESSAVIYQGGVGNALMSGCLEESYEPQDPCYQYKTPAVPCAVCILR